MTAAAFLEQAQALLGTPFMHQGRSRYGVDCIGLVVLAAQRAGLDVSADQPGYPRDPNGLLQPALARRLVPVDGARQPGDVLLMRFAEEPQHVAIWDGAMILHAYARAGRVVRHHLDARWTRRLVATYRFPEFG